MHSFLTDVIIPHAYYLLIPLAIFEGPLVAIGCGVGAALGYLNPFIAFGILIGGDFLPDIGYYLVGRYGSTLQWVQHYLERRGIVGNTFQPLRALWHTRLFSTMASSKLSYIASPVFIVSAGLSRISLWRFVAASLAVSVPYLGGLIGLGYGFTLFYGFINVSGHAAPFIAVLGLSFLCVMLYAMYAARRRLRLLSQTT